MHAALARKRCVVEKGIELMSFEQFPDCVNVKLVKRRGEKLVQEEERYKWMVGADGTAPVIRELLGLQLFGDVTTVQSSIGEIRIDDGLPPDVRHHPLLHSNITHSFLVYSLGTCGEIHLKKSKRVQLVVCDRPRTPA